jgi:hypothetical protein
MFILQKGQNISNKQVLESRYAIGVGLELSNTIYLKKNFLLNGGVKGKTWIQ